VPGFYVRAMAIFEVMLALTFPSLRSGPAKWGSEIKLQAAIRSHPCPLWVKSRYDAL
jgi:hypothetical protein